MITTMQDLGSLLYIGLMFSVAEICVYTNRKRVNPFDDYRDKSFLYAAIDAAHG